MWRPGRVVLNVIPNCKHETAVENSTGEWLDAGCIRIRGSSNAKERCEKSAGQRVLLSLIHSLICAPVQRSYQFQLPQAYGNDVDWILTIWALRFLSGARACGRIVASSPGNEPT